MGQQEPPTAWLVRDCSPASDHPLYTSLTGAQKRMRLLQQAPLAPTTEDARMTQGASLPKGETGDEADGILGANQSCDGGFL